MHAHTQTRTQAGSTAAHNLWVEIDGAAALARALLVGGPDEIAQKILEHSAALGGISRLSFQMDVAALPHAKLMQAITLLGERVAPLVRAAA